LARTNELGPPYIISPGQRLRIPSPTAAPNCPDGKIIVASPAHSAPAPMHLAAAPAPVAVPVAPKAAQIIATPAKVSPVAKPPARGASQFLWPVDGKVVSGYGPKRDARQNNGINIAASPGAPVRAAENGVVVYAGNELRGYGNLLLVRHADGWTSAYAHNGELLVDRGTVVERGQVIAKVGTTGSVNSPQSHFELRKGAKAVDPLKYLSPR
jgi:murein DD-endopeptidase MepM/ murein hydrolase activator NlpD